MVAFYNAKDRAIYDAGDKFISQSKYLQNDYIPTEGISYEGDGSPVSYANSMGGIMTQAPIPRPLQYIREGGGGGGRDITGPPDLGEVTADDYGSGTKGNMGMTDEEQDAINAMNKGATIGPGKAFGYTLGTAFAPTMTMGLIHRDRKKQEAELLETAKAAARQADRDREVKSIQGRLDSGMSLSDIGRESYTGPGQAFEARSTGTGRGPKKDGGRAGYFFGGRVNYKQGGRTGYAGGYSVQDDMGDYAENVGKEAAPGGGFVGEGGDGGGTKPTFYGKNNNIITTDFISENPNLTVDYTDPRNYASVYGKIGFNNILDNDDITAEGNVTGKLGSIGYNTNFTDQGITGTNLTAGNFNANLNPDMQVQNIGYNNNINGINYGVNTDFDNTMLTAGVNFKNGGLASIL